MFVNIYLAGRLTTASRSNHGSAVRLLVLLVDGALMGSLSRVSWDGGAADANPPIA
jgi:hypothetical protein